MGVTVVILVGIDYELKLTARLNYKGEEVTRSESIRFYFRITVEEYCAGV